jgi:hypothetical protein
MTASTAPYTKSMYSILSNKPVSSKFSGAYYEISYKIPPWFVNWKGKKLFKVYGCAFAYLKSENKVPKPNDKYANQFISVHSNIARNDTENLLSSYSLALSYVYGTEAMTEYPKYDESVVNENYMMVVNNYYIPKLYDLINSDIKEIKIWFKYSHGELIILRTSYSSEAGIENGWELDEIYQAVFKIECELFISD